MYSKISKKGKAKKARLDIFLFLFREYMIKLNSENSSCLFPGYLPF